MWRKSTYDDHLNKFRKYYFKTRKVPSLQKWGEIIWLSSKASVHNFYQNLVKSDFLSKQDNEYFPTKKLMSIPLFESIHAGFPSPATDDLKSEMCIEEYMIDNPNSTIMLKVKGDSMIDAGIKDGDIIVVDKSRKHRMGDIVVAIIDGEYTVKYLQKDKDGAYFLSPWNPKYEDIYPKDDLEVFGVVLSSFRRY